MPIIDLKNCHMYFEDGYAEAGAINLMAGYMAGATSIVIDGVTGIVPAGARVSIGSFDMYKVVSTVESSGNTTTLVITPGLQATAADDAVVTIFGTFVEIRIGDGTLQWTENKPREFKKDRGRLYQVRDADEEPMDVSFQLMYEELTASDPGTDPPTPEDALKQFGSAAEWVSTNPDLCAPFAINIRFEHDPPNCTTFDKERVILPQFYYEKLDHDPKQGMISCSGKCNATQASITRV